MIVNQIKIRKLNWIINSSYLWYLIILNAMNQNNENCQIILKNCLLSGFFVALAILELNSDFKEHLFLVFCCCNVFLQHLGLIQLYFCCFNFSLSNQILSIFSQLSYLECVSVYFFFEFQFLLLHHLDHSLKLNFSLANRGLVNFFSWFQFFLSRLRATKQTLEHLSFLFVFVLCVVSLFRFYN